MSSFPKNESGVAILTSMLVVTLGTLIATNLMWQANLDLRRAETALATDQGLMYLQGAEAWAGEILRQDQLESPDSDHLGEKWAIQLSPMAVEGGLIAGHLEDLQGRFNLNNLITPQGEEDLVWRSVFERLLISLNLDPSIAGVAVDWLDADSSAGFPRGAEDAAYAGSNPPYRVPNSIITSSSELRAMFGLELQDYSRLLPYVTALPIGTRLNVNTASEYVLASLSSDISLAAAESMIREQRGLNGFIDINNTFERLLDQDLLPRIDAVSQHFLLVASVSISNNQTTMYSLLQRDDSGIARSVFRSLGVE